MLVKIFSTLSELGMMLQINKSELLALIDIFLKPGICVQSYGAYSHMAHAVQSLVVTVAVLCR